MKTFEAFQDAIESSLSKLEKLRKTQLKATEVPTQQYLIPTALFIIALILYCIINPIIGVFMLFVAGAVSWKFLDTINDKTQETVELFEHKALAIIIKKLYPTASFNALKSINVKNLKKSNLFADITDYTGKNLIKGKTEEGAKFQLCEVQFQHSSSAKKTPVVFDGFFFEITTQHNFQSQVLLRPNKGKKTPQSSQGMDQLSLKGLTADGDLVPVFNIYPKFENDFAVYSHSREMAYYMLPPPIVEGILAIKTAWNTTPEISFINDKIYLAISSDQSYCAIDIDTVIENGESLRPVYDDLSFLLNVVQHMTPNLPLPDEIPKEENSDNLLDDLEDDRDLLID